MGMIYTPDESIYVYADSLEDAIKEFKEEMGYPDGFLYKKEDWIELSLNTIAYVSININIGGYNEVEFEDIIRWNNIKAPYVFTDIEWELNRLE